MLSLALFALFALCGLASGLVLADSGMRAVGAWRRLRGELRTLKGECATTPEKAEAPCPVRIARLNYPDLTQAGLRAAA